MNIPRLSVLRLAQLDALYTLVFSVLPVTL